MSTKQSKVFSVIRSVVNTVFAVVFGAVLIGWIGHYFTGRFPDVRPGYFLLSGAFVLTYWVARLQPQPGYAKDFRLHQLRSPAGLVKAEHRPDGTLVQTYEDGTRLIWKDGKLVAFACTESTPRE